MKDIREITSEELCAFLKENGEGAFRAKQIEKWLWKKHGHSFDAMSDLSLHLREKLKKHFTFKTTSIFQELQSKDKTVKFVFAFHDKAKVEGVLIPSRERVTACISSQVGCPLACRFCATGTMGFVRNLHFSEIIDQFALMNEKAKEYFGTTISNIVYMGMGEPLLNYDNVMASIDLLTSAKGQEMSPSRITLSTVGIVKGIRQLTDDGFKAGLAVSLHTTNELVRREIMPVTNTNSLSELQSALQYFVQKTDSRITFEYTMLRGVNDTLLDAEHLAKYCRAFPVKINIIEYNAVDSTFKGSSRENIEKFVQFLESKNMIINIRKSKGEDISAACGQLVRKY